jgi:uncharacterized protein YrzB (UPF0473 family)
MYNKSTDPKVTGRITSNVKTETEDFRMSEQNKLPEEEQIERFTLTDEEGNEIEFELIGSGEVDGVMYYAMIPAEEADDENRDTFEYVILKSEVDENGDESLFTIDDDEEFDRVADFFDDMFSTVDFDD